MQAFWPQYYTWKNTKKEKIQTKRRTDEKYLVKPPIIKVKFYTNKIVGIIF